MANNYLITGYWGEPHVTPENNRGIQAGIVGEGRYVLPVGERFAAEYIGNNTIRMRDGKLLDGGAAAGIPAGEYIDLNIANCSQGKKRIDLIVFQYEKNVTTQIETGVFVVVQGAETTGTPSDPALRQSDLLTDDAIIDQMPLWRVTVNGTSISAPVRAYTLAIALDGITAAAIGAAAAGHTHTPASIGAASAGHTHTAEAVGAAAANHTHTPASIGAAADNHTHDLSGADLVGALPLAKGGHGANTAAQGRVNMGIQCGVGESQSLGADSATTKTVTFATPFANPPIVVAGLRMNGMAATSGRCAVIVDSITATGFKAYLCNGSNESKTLSFHWIAIASE